MTNRWVNLFLISLLTCYWVSAVKAEELTLLFVGDAMQHQSQINNAFRNGRYDYSSYFQHVTYEISQADRVYDKIPLIVNYLLVKTLER
jgi:hypothetical protein